LIRDWRDVTQNPAALDDFGGLLHWTRLHDWLAEQSLPGSGPVTGVRKLPGGLQNSVFLLNRGEASFVLRRPPKHLRGSNNDTMLREARVLRALDASPVPHPRFYAVCRDESVIGACFYLMEALEGFSPRGELWGHYADDAAWRRAMGEELVDAAAALGAIEPQSVGLEDFGKPEDWHARQVSRLQLQLDSHRSMPNYEGGLPHVTEVGRWLADQVPRDGRIGIIHGDLQFANVMFSAHRPRISGIVDWELATLGDPLLDLGWILASWWEEGDPQGKRPLLRPWQGFLSRNDLVRRYAEMSGRDVQAMPWFFALACYKLACLLEGTFARSNSDEVSRSIGEQLHAYAIWLMNKATQVIAG
jgi:aminoglycoside phosphotransferase (APT) family kinase protein